MTVSRPYGEPKPAEQALAECLSLIGRQFTKTAVGALAHLHSGGELNGEPELVSA